MVIVKPTITLEFKAGRIITIDLQEAKEVIRNLSKFVIESSSVAGRGRKPAGSRKRAKAAIRGRKKKSRRSRSAGESFSNVSMSETKRQEIVDHVSKQLSARPKTLSALLKGISYIPNHLPAIRQMVESRGNVSKEMIGKRVYYSRRASSPLSQKQSRANAATP